MHKPSLQVAVFGKRWHVVSYLHNCALTGVLPAAFLLEMVQYASSIAALFTPQPVGTTHPVFSNEVSSGRLEPPTQLAPLAAEGKGPQPKRADEQKRKQMRKASCTFTDRSWALPP